MYENSSGSGNEIGVSKNLVGSGWTMFWPREAMKVNTCSSPPRPICPARPGSIHHCTKTCEFLKTVLSSERDRCDSRSSRRRCDRRRSTEWFSGAPDYLSQLRTKHQPRSAAKPHVFDGRHSTACRCSRSFWQAQTPGIPVPHRASRCMVHWSISSKPD